MKNFTNILFTELYKLKRVKLIWITIGLFLFMPFMMGLMLYIAIHPESAANVGLFAMKAKMFGANDWSGFLNTIIQAGSGLGFVGSGFCFAYIFGREYTDKTMKDLLALPVSRNHIVVAKLIIATIWSLLLFIILIVFSILIGKLVGISGSFEVVPHLIKQYFLMSICIILINTPIAFFASVGRGILAPIGFCVITLIFSNLITTIGIGNYFPWAIPSLIGIEMEIPGLAVNSASVIILLITSILGVIFTLRFWNQADHK